MDNKYCIQYKLASSPLVAALDSGIVFVARRRSFGKQLFLPRSSFALLSIMFEGRGNRAGKDDLPSKLVRAGERLWHLRLKLNSEAPLQTLKDLVIYRGGLGGRF